MRAINEYNLSDKPVTGFLIIDRTGKILYANPGAQNLALEKTDVAIGTVLDNAPEDGQYLELSVRDRNQSRSFKAIVLSEPIDVYCEGLRVLTIYSLDPCVRSYRETVFSGQRLNSLFCDMIESMLIVDSSNGKILWSNPCASATFGYAPEELVGKHFTCIFPRGSEIKATNVLNEVVCADGVFLTQSFQRNDGQIFYMDLTASLIPWEAESSAILAVFRDASERKQMEEVRLETERLRSFSELSAGVAHHFNNMLQVIIGFAGLAQTEIEKADPSRIKQRLEQIIVSSNAAASAIRSLQDFARCGQPVVSAYRNVVNLKILAQRAIDLSRLWWRTQSEKRGIVVSIDTDLKDDCYINVNQDRILEVMINLVKNGVESLSGNGTVRVGVESDDHDATFYVQDTGVGIREADLKRIFDPFWTTKGPAKSGLGLPSAMGIVRQNNGEITVESSEGGGSIFRVKFPRTEIFPGAGSRQGSKDTTENLMVLLIDEEEKVVESLSDGLVSRGYSVHTANTVKEGLRILDGINVDVIVSDAGVQDMNGWDLGRTLKNRFSGLEKKKPILILLTAWGVEEESKHDLMRAGVDRVLSKPVSIQDLDHYIKEILSRNH
jgi:two-component system, cell cycle sensor histidine kinase and response regulator CckA